MVELSQVKELVPVSASPDCDWYIKAPHPSFLLLGLAVHLRLEDLRVAEFFPSTTTAWAAEAVPVVLVTVISPVEYIKGLPEPPVDKVQPVHETVPSPLSVAKVAQDPPVDETVTFVAVIVPPYVACNPLAEALPVEVTVVPDIVTFPPFVATKAFPPLALVDILPPVIVNPPPWTNTAAFIP